MSVELEEPVKTLIRLLKANLRVVKDNGELANIHIGNEWYNSEISRQNDGQITVGLQNCQEQKLSTDGKVRLSTINFRINVWVLDKLEKSTEAREMRNKIVNEIKRVLCEKSSSPNNFTYNFAGVGRESGEHKAFYAISNSELAINSQVWSELTSDEYVKLWYSDDDRLSLEAQQNGEYPLLLFKFKLDAKPEVLKILTLNFEGYGEAATGNGVTVKVWNFGSGSWDKFSTGSSGLDETISITVSSDFESFMDEEGYVYMLARTTNPCDGVTSSILRCDYAWMDFSVNGLSYCDIVAYRNLDRVDVKPFIWRTELTAKGWIFKKLV
ncbi:hypothetical protein DRO54_06070 [Candidatus Bathyarchaeota archaeon]|nr:MAG: hypothetical protein DRO54_06070 [Candidatus Bathyarchaeota archaeon]